MKKIKVTSIFMGNISQIKSAKSQVLLGGDVATVHSEIEKEVYKKYAMLIKVADCGYVDIDSIHSIFDQLRIKRCLNKHGGFTMGGIVLDDIPTATLFDKEGDLHVERESLKPYPFTDEQGEISLRKLKKIRNLQKKNTLNNI